MGVRFLSGGPFAEDKVYRLTRLTDAESAATAIIEAGSLMWRYVQEMRVRNRQMGPSDYLNPLVG